MNRNLMRYTLMGLMLLAILSAVLPEVAKALGVKILGEPLSTISEKHLSDGACVDEGVTLVVDYGTVSKRQKQVFCLVNFGQKPSDTGWGLFGAANVKVEGTKDYPTGFVCRVNDYPSASQESCDMVPSATHGSWAYFTAVPGSGWRYSPAGAAMSYPTCGQWQGWRYIEAGESRNNPPRLPAMPIKCNA